MKALVGVGDNQILELVSAHLPLLTVVLLHELAMAQGAQVCLKETKQASTELAQKSAADGNSTCTSGGNSVGHSAIRTAIRGQFKAIRARFRQFGISLKPKTWEIRQFGPRTVCLLKF